MASEKSRRSRSRRGRGQASAPRLGGLALVARLPHWLIASLFFLLLLVGPLPMGANRDWAWAPMVVVIGLIAVLVAFGLAGGAGFAVRSDEKVPLLVLSIFFVATVAAALLQMLPIAPQAGSAPYYAQAAKIFGRTESAVISVAVDTSLADLMKCVACGLVFLVARAICASENGARALLMTLIASALLVMGYGILMKREADSCYVGSFLKKAGDYIAGSDHCLMSGTFVSSNAFACYLGMAVMAALALIFNDRRSRRQRLEEELGEEEGENRLVKWLTGSRIALMGVGFFLFGGVMISGSRAGFAATVVGAAALGYILMHGRWRSRAHLSKTLFAAILVAGAAALIAGSSLLHKISHLPSGDAVNRIVIWRTTLQAIEKSPWLGWGLGSYQDVFTTLQPNDMTQPNDKAHSTPLETIVELGIPAAVVAMIAVALPWWICLRGALRRRRHRYLMGAAFAVATVPILHSMVDFSLQMPAIAFMVSAFLGMGWAQAFIPTEPPATPRTFTVPPE